MSYNGWKLSDTDRDKLLVAFPPRHPDVLAHHVTNNLKNLIPEPASITVIGYAANEGVECLVVAVNGETARPDGRTYHITWSIDRAAGFKPVNSNNLIEGHGYEEVTPIEADFVPFKVVNGEEYF